MTNSSPSAISQVEGFDRGNHAVANDEMFIQTADRNHRVYGSIGVALGLLQSPDWEKAKVKLK